MREFLCCKFHGRRTLKKYMALVGNCPKEAKEKLLRQKNITKVTVLPPDELVSSPVGCHPDTILCIFGCKLFCHRSYAEKNRQLISEICSASKLELCAADGARSGVYPQDCAFNALTIPEKNTVIGRKKSLCPPLSSIAVNCNQGYAACGALNVGGTVLTADTSVLKALKEANVEAVRVSGGDIPLPGYDTGFIGGCGGFYENTLCVFGDPTVSKTGSELCEFCRQAGVELISLADGPLTDYGGIKFLPIA